jgi:hypothetical protein
MVPTPPGHDAEACPQAGGGRRAYGEPCVVGGVRSGGAVRTHIVAAQSGGQEFGEVHRGAAGIGLLDLGAAAEPIG